jgi:hypothetical protein
VTAAGLVTLFLSMIHPSTYFHPNDPLQCLPFTPQLEMLVISLLFPFPHRDAGEATHAHTNHDTRNNS